MKTIYIEKDDPHTTLTTWIYCAFWMMCTAEQLGCKSYINWKRQGCLQMYVDNEMFNKIPNMYEWYFEQPMINGSTPDEVWKWEGWRDPVPVSLMSQPLSIMKAYFKKYLKFNAITNSRGEALVKKYNIDFKNTIGITWRGTDNVTDGRPRLPIETYFPFIDEIIEKNPGMRIMCTAEEQGILIPLFARYPQAFNIDEFISAPKGSLRNPEVTSNVSGYERGLQPALMVWIFSKCAHYIKNRSSTGAVASWISDGRIVCIGHEETLSYNLSYDYVEIQGKKYTLDNKLI